MPGNIPVAAAVAAVAETEWFSLGFSLVDVERSTEQHSVHVGE